MISSNTPELHCDSTTTLLAVNELPKTAYSPEQLFCSITETVDALVTEFGQESLQTLKALTMQLKGVLIESAAIEQRLKRTHALLKAQREASIDGILVVDEHNEIISVNQPFYEFWQVPDEIKQSRDDRQVLAYAVGQTANPEEFLAKVQFLYQHPTEKSRDEVALKDGRFGDRYSAPVISEDGEYFGRVWYFRDITDRKNNEVALKKLNEDLELRVQERTTALERSLEDFQHAQAQLVQSEKMSALGDLVSGVAHEINNPVGFIAGNIQPALDYSNDLFGLLNLYQSTFPQPGKEIEAEITAIDLDYIRDDLPKLISSMQEGVNRIQDISTSLRTFSRADTDTSVAFDIHSGLDSTILILKHRLKATNARPAIAVIQQYGDLPSVECYAGQLNQVFMNLLANAIDALEDRMQNCASSAASKALASTEKSCLTDIKANPNQIVIQTQLTHNGEQVEIRIQDNGVGMPEEVQQKVFDHLFTTKSVGQGTGLGLAIVRQIIVEKHHGSVEMNSAVGRGTEFRITIPVKTTVSK